MGSIKFKTPRTIKRGATARTTSKADARKIQFEQGGPSSQPCPPSSVNKENQFKFQVGANVHTSPESASEAIRIVLKEQNSNINEKLLSNLVKKVLKGKMTLNACVSRIGAK